MVHVLSVEVAEDVYEPLARLASACGRRPDQLASDWLRSRADALRVQPARPAPADSALGELLQFAGAASLGRPTGADNTAIDADLAAQAGR
jgi:hypothetical protein